MENASKTLQLYKEVKQERMNEFLLFDIILKLIKKNAVCTVTSVKD